MENQSNSKYYHGDCVCKKKNVPTRIAIECEDCIVDDPERYFNNSRGYTCSCIDIEINHAMCEICALDRDEIDTLSDALDDIMYTLSFNIKQYINCEEKLKEINIIAKRMRHLNRRLLERLIPTTTVAPLKAEPMETETNPETSTTEPMEIETNPETSTTELSEEAEYEYDYEEEEEDEGIGCNNCYACVSGGSSPCILDLVSNQTDETDNEIETNEMMPKFILAEDNIDWHVPLARNEVCSHNM
jgi:hypothetical protein